MFGLDDWFFIRNVEKRRKEEIEDQIKIKSEFRKDSEKVWFCYLPGTVFDSPFLLKRALPKSDSFIAYRLSRKMVSLNPEETIKLFEEIYNLSAREIKKRKLKNICVLGMSFGSSIACLLARNFPVEKAVLVVPGADLPYCMFNSSYTKKLFGEEEIKKHDINKAEKIFSQLNPINNLSNLPKDTFIYLSFWDRIMPYKDSVRIVRKLKENRKKYKAKTNYFFGHSLTIVGFNNKF